MIEGGWAYVIPAYAATMIGLGALTLAIVLKARRWAQRVRALEERK